MERLLSKAVVRARVICSIMCEICRVRERDAETETRFNMSEIGTGLFSSQVLLAIDLLAQYVYILINTSCVTHQLTTMSQKETTEKVYFHPQKLR